jgi:2'-hydroxyisoflavone reductase
MRLLILGGTRFLGRGVVDAALAHGDEVTTFTRGVSGEPPAGVESLHGDRTKPGGLDVLRGREWDAVIDTCGFVPAVVDRDAALLADAVGHYVFVSSISAYEDFPAQPITAGSRVSDCEPDAGDPDGAFDPELYGPYKAGCERAVERRFPGRSASLRAGMIVGPYDDTGRFPYWVARVARGGEILAPGDPDAPLRLVDQRDLGAWAVEVARSRTAGAFVATGPEGQITFGGMLAAMDPDARVTWVDEDWLVARGVKPWSELPLWLPQKESPHTYDQDTTAAEAAGLRTRPVAETAADTLSWLRAGAQGAPNPRVGRAGLDAGKERELLTAWHSA